MHIYFIILYIYIMLYYIILYYFILYYIILHYIILYYIVLYYIVLYYIVLYCIILYYIVIVYIYIYYYHIIYIYIYIYHYIYRVCSFLMAIALALHCWLYVVSSMLFGKSSPVDPSYHSHWRPHDPKNYRVDVSDFTPCNCYFSGNVGKTTINHPPNHHK